MADLLGSRLRIEIFDETNGSIRHNFSLSGTFLPERNSPEQAAKELSEQLGIDARIETRPLEHIFLDGPAEPPKRIIYQTKEPVPPAPCPAP